MENKENVDNTEYVNWTLPRLHSFVQTLLQVSLCSEIDELKDQAISDYVWMEVETKLCINYQMLKDMWYHQLHMQLFAPEPLYYKDIQLKLIDFLHNKRVTRPEMIDWEKLASKFEGTTPPFLQSVTDELLNVARTDTERHKFRDLVSYLYNEYKPFLIKSPEQPGLARLHYDEGRLTIIDRNLHNANNNYGGRENKNK